MTHMAGLMSIALLHFFFQFLSNFMVMINIKKFELINAIESCLSNIFPDIHPIFI